MKCSIYKNKPTNPRPEPNLSNDTITTTIERICNNHDYENQEEDKKRTRRGQEEDKKRTRRGQEEGGKSYSTYVGGT